MTYSRRACSCVWCIRSRSPRNSDTAETKLALPSLDRSFLQRSWQKSAQSHTYAARRIRATLLTRSPPDPDWPTLGSVSGYVDSEVARLRTVMLHRPGPELARLTPRNND